MSSLSWNGATNKTIKNGDIRQAWVVGNCISIYSGTSTSVARGSAPTANSGNTYTNNILGRTNYGMLIQGASAQDNGVTINSNTIDSIQTTGFYVSNQTNFNIYSNYFDVACAAGYTGGLKGIDILNNCTNGNIYRNNIAKLYQRGSSSTY